MAAVLGFQERSSIRAEMHISLSGPTVSITLSTAPPPEPTMVSKPLVDVPFWRLETVEYPQAPKPTNNGPELVAALPEWTERPAAAIPQPLARWPELLPRLRGTLARKMESCDLDVPAIVCRLGQGDSLRRLPHRSCRRWGTTLHVIEDRSDRLTPYWRDQTMVREQLLRLFPRHAVRHALIDEGLDHPLFVGLPRGADRRYHPPPPGGLVLVLGDLGGLAREDVGASANWERLGQCLADAGRQAVALLPQPAAWCSPMIGRYWRLLSWERGPGALDPKHCWREIETLLYLLAPTARVEPGLLRDLRRLVGLEAAAESLVWQHPAVTSTSSVAATLNPENLKRWRTGFEGQQEPFRKQVLDRIRAWRARLPSEVYLGEAALLDSDSQALLPAEERQLCHDFFVALDAQIRGIGGATAPRGAEEWFLRFEQRSTKQEAIWRTLPLHRIWERVHRHDQGQIQPPPEFKPESIKSDPDQPITTVTIQQEGKTLIFAPKIEIEEPSAGSRLGLIPSRNGWIGVKAVSNADRNAFWRSGQSPRWADRWWGTDKYGHWIIFIVNNKKGHEITQRMRWIETGAFQMGSPENELEHRYAEGPQHPVTISQGFWLFDTACTQALWEAVMGENPSRFKGVDRPVENVSWNNCQDFIKRLNERLPGLNLALPSEAQWEYACRAGTTTPFSFGDNITPEQVNYNGNFPYAGGNKGLYREQTVPVASLPPNPWGLYEMHGNVWEWCKDHWHGNYQGAPDDGSVWRGRNAWASHILRGGSWNFYARHARAACRSEGHPDYRYVDVGFRCIRVRGEPSQERAEPAGPARGRQAERRPEQGQPGGASGAAPMLLRLDAGQSPACCPLPQMPAFLIHTDRERLTFRRLTKPEWASAIGRDRFGLWCEIEIDPGHGGPVIQRLRWIPPGRFWMGSPEEEQGRFDGEGPRHQVTLTEGYWLFDTPCTQALWEAVMKKNPSRFQSLTRPVEQVRWNDVLTFMNLINAWIPGLDLALPSEAQWEYACRAGTDTAIYTGALAILGERSAPALDPIAWYGGNSGVDFELDNGYHSSDWKEKQYPHTKAGTRPVKLKRANLWGLYDVLGNVWEWTQDHWHDDYRGAPTDGSAWISSDTGAYRVLRGGSWFSDARLVRAAYRLHDRPSIRSINFGFRCARFRS
jgi:formylglycine-generating enzyme required for sulfatase activity